MRSKFTSHFFYRFLTQKIITSFMKEIYASPVDERNQASTAFRVSKLCDCMGFDSKELIQRESFWLLYDDEEVGDPDEA